jgi:multisubunit Na+/H+ antiporter MnhG subunit
MNEDALKSRAIGLVLLCVGVGLTYWNHSMRVNDGRYYIKLAFLGPVLICMAINVVIEAPPFPVTKMTVFGWICCIVGIALGFWNAFF